MKNYDVWYRVPASRWYDALPIGNGRIGAMIYGDPLKERVALNEDTLWSGYPKKVSPDNAPQHLKKAQSLALAGQLFEAQRAIEDAMPVSFTEEYLPLGEMSIDFQIDGKMEDYRRSLSLNDSVSRVSFTAQGTSYTREAFVSAPDQVFVMRVVCDRKGGITFALRLSSALRTQFEPTGDGMMLQGVAPSKVLPCYVMEADAIAYDEEDERKGMRFCAAVKVQATGGSVLCEDGCVMVTGADEAFIWLTARTSFNGFERQPYTDGVECFRRTAEDLRAASAIPFAELYQRHIADVHALFDRAEIRLDGHSFDELPTDERLLRFEKSPDDTGLYELIFQYGRYLMIAGSRESTQPMTLQGIWNDDMRAPWSCNYTINMNTQMNYWAAEITNLSELHEPMLRMIDELRTTGADVARKDYDAGGVVAHHNVDLWRYSDMAYNRKYETSHYAFWNVGYGWLCQHLIEHYEYTGDVVFLREKALPALRDAVRFFLDVMAVDENGDRFLCPASTPERKFSDDGHVCGLSKSAAMSNAIVREVLRHYLEALRLLDADEPMRAEAEDALKRVKRYVIDDKGVILEYDEPRELLSPERLSMVHLYGLCPGDEISWDDTPELAAACRRWMLMAEPRNDSSLSNAWKLACWVALGMGDKALHVLQNLLKLVDRSCGLGYKQPTDGMIYRSLFAAYSPAQIDPNFVMTASIAKMLVQSRRGVVTLLPALPTAWENGSVRGLRVHGGLTLDMTFANHKVQRAVLRRIEGSGTICIHWNGQAREINPDIGECVTLC